MSSFRGDFEAWSEARFDPSRPPLSGAKAQSFLLDAVMNDQSSDIQDLLEDGSWVGMEKMDQTASNPIRMALSLGQDRCLNAFLNSTDCALWAFEHRQTLLHLAVTESQEWAIAPLLQAGARIDAPNIAGLTPVALAGSLGKTEALKEMLEWADELGAGFENSLTPFWQIENPASSLAIALVAHAKGVQERSGSKQRAFIRDACQELFHAGSDPNAPQGALVLMSMTLCRNFTAPQEEIDEAFSFALSLGARWDAPGPQGRLALEIAGAHLDEALADCLLRLGAPLGPRSLLALPAWGAILRRAKHPESPSPDERAISTLLSWCQKENFWPPFASDPASCHAYLSQLGSMPRQSAGIDAERLELFAGTRGSSPGAPSRAPRI